MTNRKNKHSKRLSGVRIMMAPTYLVSVEPIPAGLMSIYHGIENDLLKNAVFNEYDRLCNLGHFRDEAMEQALTLFKLIPKPDMSDGVAEYEEAMAARELMGRG